MFFIFAETDSVQEKWDVKAQIVLRLNYVPSFGKIKIFTYLLIII